MKPGLRKVSDTELLAEFEKAMSTDGEPVLTATEIAERKGMRRQSIQSRLKKLRERGVVDCKKVGARAKVWWLTEIEEDYELRSSDSAATR